MISLRNRLLFILMVHYLYRLIQIQISMQYNPDYNKRDMSPETKEDVDKAFNHEIREQEKKAGEQWEKVKDKTSGVDKDLEKKLEKGTIEPKDLETQGG